MNRIFGIMLSAALLCGGTALAATPDENCETQLHAQIQTLQAEVAALLAASNVQSDESASGYQMPTGG